MVKYKNYHTVKTRVQWRDDDVTLSVYEAGDNSDHRFMVSRDAAIAWDHDNDEAVTHWEYNRTRSERYKIGEL